MDFNLKARINRSDARTIWQTFDQLAAKGSVSKEGDEFIVEAQILLRASRFRFSSDRRY